MKNLIVLVIFCAFLFDGSKFYSQLVLNLLTLIYLLGLILIKTTATVPLLLFI